MTWEPDEPTAEITFSQRRVRVATRGPEFPTFRDCSAWELAVSRETTLYTFEIAGGEPIRATGDNVTQRIVRRYFDSPPQRAFDVYEIDDVGVRVRRLRLWPEMLRSVTIEFDYGRE